MINQKNLVLQECYKASPVNLACNFYLYINFMARDFENLLNDTEKKHLEVIHRNEADTL